jgi:hypothetical protein
MLFVAFCMASAKSTSSFVCSGRPKYPRYRLMGDVINTASRMSTTASADQIQMTTCAYEVLNKSYFHTEYRGEVAVKGKGLMKTYLLLGRVELLCPPPLSVEQVQRMNGTLARGDGVAGAEQNFHAAWDGNGSDPHAGPTAAAVAAGAPTHGGLLTESLARCRAACMRRKHA